MIRDCIAENRDMSKRYCSKVVRVLECGLWGEVVELIVPKSIWLDMALIYFSL